MSAMFGFHDRLHLVVLFFFTVLIQKCTEMQRVDPSNRELRKQHLQFEKSQGHQVQGCCQGEERVTMATQCK